ncbi:glycosyltransferase [Larkinella soli]|uniref:glycosyltransferase n=1 Tax=Larkinella soli TaxID=1770527 RepID=UPI0013E3488F|nr:glycosyltransferase [Larkinella soli]
MKLCIAYPNRNNYSETFIYNHLHYLKPALSLSGGWRPYRTQDGENLIRLPLAEALRVGVKRGLPWLYPAFYTYYLSRYLKENRPEVVLAEYGPTGTAVLDACRKTGVPLVVHFHGFDASDQVSIEKYRRGYQALFAYAKAVVAVSADMAQQLIRLGADPEKIHRNPYGVDTGFFQGARPETADKIVLAVGRFTGKKAPHLTIRAFDKVLERHPDARLVMIGNGELLEASRKLVGELELKHAVSFEGVKKAEEIAAWHRKARLFVQHSVVNPANGDSEGTPNTVLEASASGLPIVSTRHAGIKEAVDHEVTGFLVEEGDVEGMANYIHLLLSDPKKAGELGRNARQKMIREYEMSDRTAELARILQA